MDTFVCWANNPYNYQIKWKPQNNMLTIADIRMYKRKQNHYPQSMNEKYKQNVQYIKHFEHKVLLEPDSTCGAEIC